MGQLASVPHPSICQSIHTSVLPDPPSSKSKPIVASCWGGRNSECSTGSLPTPLDWSPGEHCKFESYPQAAESSRSRGGALTYPCVPRCNCQDHLAMAQRHSLSTRHIAQQQTLKSPILGPLWPEAWLDSPTSQSATEPGWQEPGLEQEWALGSPG
jgi:hypothetical protein